MSNEQPEITTDSALFLLDPRHEPFVNGESKDLGDLSLSWFKRITIAVLIIVTILLGISALVSSDSSQTGIYVVDGTIIERLEEGVDEFDLRYIIEFTYIDHIGQEQTIARDVTFETYNDLLTTDTVQVQYEEGFEDRGVLLPEGDPSTQLSLSFVFVTFLSASVLFVAYSWLLRPSEINRRLIEDGEFIDGHLDNCWPTSIGQRYMVNVAFTFRRPDDNEVVAARQALNRKDLRHEILPKPGRTVKVRYVNPKLYRLM